MKRWIVMGLRVLILAIGGLILLVIGGLILLHESNKAEVQVVNQSGETILRGTIKVCHQQRNFQNIPPGERKKFVFKDTSECGYDLQLEFSNGQIMNRQVGYVTHGMNFDDELIVTLHEVVLKNRSLGDTSEQLK